jgi:hypothetical protein
LRGDFEVRGAIVAMTGDEVSFLFYLVMQFVHFCCGVCAGNDALALKMADIGKSGTDFAKEAADIIFVNNNFTKIYIMFQSDLSDWQ